jgi:hypothetical protein
MNTGCDYDTVAFDARDNAIMLFFARTTADGNIEDYLLLMRPSGDEFDDKLFVEVNEQMLADDETITEARMAGNVLTLSFGQPVAAFGGQAEVVVVFADTADNRAAIEAGALRVLGDRMAGGHA